LIELPSGIRERYYVAKRDLLLTFDEVRPLGNNDNLMKSRLEQCSVVIEIVVGRQGMYQIQERRGLEKRKGEPGVWYVG
jgi:hypothetical protein